MAGQDDLMGAVAAGDDRGRDQISAGRPSRLDPGAEPDRLPLASRSCQPWARAGETMKAKVGFSQVSRWPQRIRL